MANIKAIMPFWHRSRQTWVPLTRAEWFRRGASEEDVTFAVKSGLVKRTSREKTLTDIGIYEVTQKGKDMAERALK